MNTDIDERGRKPFNGAIKEETPPRRIVLRGALAAGCGLLLPAFFGCDSRKGEPPADTAPAAPSAPDTDAGAPAGTDNGTVKVTQASVQYQNQPKGDQRCGDCLHFIAGSNTCKLVEGQINPDGWCTLWAQKG